MTPEEELTERYVSAAHAVQTGISMKMRFDNTFTTPKHLRVGIDTSKADICAVARLLISKGVITEIEYLALASEMEEEKRRWENDLSKLFNKEVKLS